MMLNDQCVNIQLFTVPTVRKILTKFKTFFFFIVKLSIVFNKLFGIRTLMAMRFWIWSLSGLWGVVVWTKVINSHIEAGFIYMPGALIPSQKRHHRWSATIQTTSCFYEPSSVREKGEKTTHPRQSATLSRFFLLSLRYHLVTHQ